MLPVGAIYVSGGTRACPEPCRRVGDVVSWTVASLSIGVGDASYDAGNSAGVQFVATAMLAAKQTMPPNTNGDYRVSADGGYHAAWSGSTAVVTVISAGCEPISGVQLSHTPAGDLFTGNAAERATVRFTADANGTVPFTYTWTLNGTAVARA